jgi:hypothetical protein
MQSEITNTLTALENCICLLFPTPENFFIQDGNEIEIKSKSSEEKRSPTDCPDTKETEDQNENEEQSLEQKDRLSELTESDRQVEKNNTIKNDCDVPSTSGSKDDDMEEDSSEFGSETSDSEEDLDFREYGILNSKYHIEVNVNTGICQ